MPKLVVAFAKGQASLQARVVELGRDLGWHIQDLEFYGGGLPPGPPPQGAFLDVLLSDPILARLKKAGCHVVRLCRHSSSHRPYSFPSVVIDRSAAGRLAAEHFAERRFRHVGYVSYQDQGDETIHLYQPYRSRAMELGAEVHSIVFRELNKSEEALPREKKYRLRHLEFMEWIKRVPKPIGLFAFSSHFAGRLSVSIQDAGLEIPSQVAVLAYGGDRATCVSAPVPLSSVDADEDRQAECAVRMMGDLLAGRPAPREAVLVPPAGVVTRSSTDVLASCDPAVVKAIRYLWDNLRKDLSVDDVARAVGVARRNLERAFQDQIGHGINAELRRRRLEYCCELLRTTELPITDIGPLAGFTDKNYLHVCFRRAYGMTPRKWRLKHMV